MRYLLDANAIIDWLNGRQRVADLLASLAGEGDRLVVNAVALAEVFSGLSEDESVAAEPALGSLEFWDIDEAVARLAGSYRYEYARQGRKLPVADTLMAAHAVSRDATLVTRNIRDFPMPQLKILSTS